MRKLAGFVLVLLVVFGCKKKEEDNRVDPGTVSVVVKFDDGDLVQGARVYTIPSTVSDSTDEFGQVLLSGIQPGTYEVYAELAEFGQGKSPVIVKNDELSRVDITVSYNPELIKAPRLLDFQGDYGPHTAEDTVVMVMWVTDDATANEDIKITAKSDIDGVLGTGNPDSDGKYTFSTHSLSAYHHTITFTLEDTDGYSYSFTYQVDMTAPANIILQTPTFSDGTVSLNWGPYDHEHVSRFDVYRSEGDNNSFYKIATITDRNTTSYIDYDLPFGEKFTYYIRVSFSEVFYTTTSNYQTIVLDDATYFNFNIEQVLQHPSEPIIYLISTSNYNLVKYNFETGETIASVDLQGSINRVSLGDNGAGLKIYVPTQEGTIIIYNANTLELESSIQVGSNVSNAYPAGNDYLLVSLNQFSATYNLQVFRESTKSKLRDYETEDNLVFFPLGNSEYFGFEQSGWSSRPVHFDFSTTNGSVNNLTDDYRQIGSSINSKIIDFSSDGYFVTDSEGTVLTADANLTKQGELLKAGDNFTDFAYSKDNQKIYASSSESTGKIYEYSSDTFIKENEFQTRGYTRHVLVYENKLVFLSKNSSFGSTITGVFKIDLE